MLKILFLATWYPFPADNGAKLRVHYLLRALAACHEVTLISFAFDTAQPDMHNDLQRWCQDIQSVPLNPFSVNRVGRARTFLSARPVASRPLPAMSKLVSDALHLQVFDVVIASTEMMADYVLLAGGETAKILEEHNSMTRWAHERYEGARSLPQRVRLWGTWQKRRWFEARYYPQFDLITMVSESDRAVTVETIGAEAAHVEVVPNGVDCVHNQPGLADASPWAIVYNGALTYSANYEAMRWFLSKIYPKVKEVITGVSLTITGSISGVDLGGLAVDDTVHFSGYVDDVRIPVAEASVCVVPIRQGGGTRLKILEAMALGTPLVSTSKGAEGLDVVEGEHLLLADDPETFANCTVRLLQDRALQERLAANARALVECRYDWREIGDDFVALVEAAVEHKRKSGL